MNSILIYPQLEFAKIQIPTPPYSILFIADYLLKRNVDVKIFDLRFDKLSQVFDAISVVFTQLFFQLKLFKINS